MFFLNEGASERPSDPRNVPQNIPAAGAGLPPSLEVSEEKGYAGAAAAAAAVEIDLCVNLERRVLCINLREIERGRC